MLQIEVNWYIW